MRPPFADRSITSITEGDIAELVANRVPESEFLDYKRDPNFETGDGRKEFVRDVVSFANSGGGLLVYGVDEERHGTAKTGFPGAFCGFAVASGDALLQQCFNLLRTVSTNGSPASTCTSSGRPMATQRSWSACRAVRTPRIR